MGIIEYLTSRGFSFIMKGRLPFTNSPFNPGDKTPSFAVYDNERFKCYSTGKAGNLITLMRHFNDTTKPPVSKPLCIKVKEAKDWKGKIPAQYLDVTTAEATQAYQYAKSRKLKSYLPGVSFYFKEGKWERSVPGLIFPHQNNGIITGFKLRFVEPVHDQRFTTRGTLGFYIREQLFDSYHPPILDMVEGEANADSLAQYYWSIQRPSIVMSTGSVTSIPKSLPSKYNGIKARLLVDFDGDSDKWSERVEAYAKLNLEPVKIVLPKGEDINSLWMRDEVGLIDNLL